MTSKGWLVMIVSTVLIVTGYLLYPLCSESQSRFDPIGDSYPAARRALDLLCKHESLNGKAMVGDNGRAQGWLQQHQEHWKRGCDYLGVNWPWPGGTRDLEKCEHVALANWMLDARDHLDNVEGLIRRFRLPNNPYRKDNTKYVQKVMKGK